MLLPDVNIFVYAHRKDVEDHAAYAGWLKDVVAGPEPLALSELALGGFVRIVTNGRIFKQPTPIAVALDFANELLAQPSIVRLRPREKHWTVFASLCKQANARGKLVADAYHAALAIEQGCTLITTDSDFDRFVGLRWRHPLRDR